MPIRPYLDDHRFDAETVGLMGIAFETAIVALQHGDATIDPPRAALAQKIIELAKGGERDPERLCEMALGALEPSPPAIITDPNPLLPLAPPRALRGL